MLLEYSMRLHHILIKSRTSRTVSFERFIIDLISHKGEQVLLIISNEHPIGHNELKDHLAPMVGTLLHMHFHLLHHLHPLLPDNHLVLLLIPLEYVH